MPGNATNQKKTTCDVITSGGNMHNYSAKGVRWVKLSEMLGKGVRNAKMPGDNQYMQFFCPKGKK